MKMAMKMAKPSANDIDAAYDLMALLIRVSRSGAPELEAPTNLFTLLDEEEADFDPNDDVHLATLYNHLAALLDKAPGFEGRVIGGMCGVIMYEENQILDPDSDCIDLHPRFALMQQRIEQMEGLLLWTLYNHQGGKSTVGQPIRRALNIEQHANLTPEQIEAAHRATCKGQCKTAIGFLSSGHIECADCGRTMPATGELSA